MPMNIETALAEARKQRDDIVDPLEGLRDFSRLNLQDEARRVVVLSIQWYERRDLLLAKFIEATEILLKEGYPALKPREIPVEALADLQDNKRTIDAALATFASNAATTIGLAAGGTEKK